MAVDWNSVKEFEDIRYEHFEGIAKITINRPRVRNAFRPQTVIEMRRIVTPFLIQDKGIGDGTNLQKSMQSYPGSPGSYPESKFEWLLAFRLHRK